MLRRVAPRRTRATLSRYNQPRESIAAGIARSDRLIRKRLSNRLERPLQQMRDWRWR